MLGISAHCGYRLERGPDDDTVGMVKPCNGRLRVRRIHVEEIANGVVVEHDALAEPGSDVQDIAMADALGGLTSRIFAFGPTSESNVLQDDSKPKSGSISARDTLPQAPSRRITSQPNWSCLAVSMGFILPLFLVGKAIIPRACTHAHSYF